MSEDNTDIKEEVEVKVKKTRTNKKKVDRTVESELIVEDTNINKIEDKDKILNVIQEIDKKKKETEEKNQKSKRKKNKDSVIRVVRRDPDLNLGLTTEEAEARYYEGLNNSVSNSTSKTYKQIIFGNIFTFFNFLTYSIAGWLISVKAFDELFFVLIITINTIIGIVQEIQAKKTVDRLSLLSAGDVTVVRDGDSFDIPISDVVIDDIICLSPGKQISADSIVREGSIEVDESLLTGESDAILKKENDVVLSGSFVVSGSCKVQAAAVGKNSYIQKLTSQAKKYSRPKSELLGSLKLLITIIGIIIIPIGIVLFVMQDKNGVIYDEIVRGTSGAIIGMIPSGLFLITTITLSFGVIRLGRSKTLVQELYCIETLARVNVLCLDKTGTITDGGMIVKGIIEYPNDTGVNAKVVIASMNSILDDKNLTSIALEEKFGKGKNYKFKATIPFSSSRKYSAVEFDRLGTFVLGAPEFVLKDNYSMVEKEVIKNAENGLRVLVLGHSQSKIVKNEFNGEVLPVALILIEDTIRFEAPKTIQGFKDQGVEVKVISGDNPITVSRIAERAGVANADKYIDLTNLTDKEVERIATRYNVFGRVSPQQKKILINAMKQDNNTVAMVGDGVNDILALKEANCSIAMASGSDAARSIAHLVLMDSNFSNMPKVVDEGRRVINNIQRVSVLFLTKTIFSFLLAMLTIIYGFNSNNSQIAYPIAPRQLYLIDWFVIAIPSFVLALEPNLKRIEGKFLSNVLKSALPGALTIIILSVIVYILQSPLNMGTDEMKTIITISTTFTCLMVLYRACNPFTSVRRILFGTMFIATLVMILFSGSFLGLNPFFEHYITRDGKKVDVLRLELILLTLVLAMSSNYLIYFFSNIKIWIKKLTKEFLNIISKL